MTSIISWNVNGIRAAHKKGFLEWLKTESPDIIGLQEVRARKESIPKELTEPMHSNGIYHAYWQPAKKAGYAGTAIFSKQEPLNIRTLGIDDFDNEGRVIIADFDAFSFASCYFPNSQAEGKRLDYKIAFCEAIQEFMNAERKKGRPVILAGDYNVAHKAIDLTHPESNQKNPGYLPEERAWMDRFTGAGYVDSFRHFHSEPERYSWWSYRARARERNVGWRIDYHCIHKDFVSHITDADILDTVYGSDHCPVTVLSDFNI